MFSTNAHLCLYGSSMVTVTGEGSLSVTCGVIAWIEYRPFSLRRLAAPLQSSIFVRFFVGVTPMFAFCIEWSKSVLGTIFITVIPLLVTQ